MGNDVMLRRRQLMAMRGKSELYPVGTDVVGLYYGRDETGYFIGEYYVTINEQGEFISGTYYGNSAFIEIEPSYRFVKSGYYMYRITFYDSDHRFIKQVPFYDSQEQEITDIPQGARYMRFVANGSRPSNWKITVTRIA